MSFKKIFKPINKVEYQLDAITSKTLLDNGDDSITIFALDESERINTHSAPVDAAIYVLEGELELIIDDEMFNLNSEDMILIPSKAPHALNALTRTKIMLIKI